MEWIEGGDENAERKKKGLIVDLMRQQSEVNVGGFN